LSEEVREGEELSALQRPGHRRHERRVAKRTRRAGGKGRVTVSIPAGYTSFNGGAEVQ